MNAIRFWTSAALGVLAFIGNPAIAQTQGSEEDVQIIFIDFSQTLELHNFGNVTWPMDGWRFCTHDELDGFDYTSPTGFDGMSLAPGESLFVHWLNDASGSDSVNISALGGAAIDDLLTPTPGSAISIGIYRNSTFASADSLVDHIQYSFNGANVPAAAPRAGTAVAADLWTAASDWIVVESFTVGLELVDIPFPGAGDSHGPFSYNPIGPLSFEVAPDSMNVVRGNLASGSVADLAESDNVDVSITRSASSIQPVVEFEIKGISPIEQPFAINFLYESSVFARNDVTQTISLFNYDTDSFEELDSRLATRFTDSTIIITVENNPSRFIQPGTGCMETRIKYQGISARLQYAANIDQAYWVIDR